MKALSIQQPWAWAIVNGFKPVENRTWRTPYRGEIAIHAGQTVAQDGVAAVRRLLAEDGHDPNDLPDLHDLPRGGVVGMARLVDCVRSHPSRWFFGPVGLVLADARPVSLRRCRGQLGLFDIDARALGLAEPEAREQGRLV